MGREIVQNPPGTPKVDAATFRAWGVLLPIKTASILMANARMIIRRKAGRYGFAATGRGKDEFIDSADVLKDRRNLYFQGHWLVVRKGILFLTLNPGHVVPLLFT